MFSPRTSGEWLERLHATSQQIEKYNEGSNALKDNVILCKQARKDDILWWVLADKKKSIYNLRLDLKAVKEIETNPETSPSDGNRVKRIYHDIKSM